ncbi:Protoglobin-domain-containing protein [Chaetomium strumarium]|uniref:Protoglobin-domain-containing protein n=1 Tax=Chaetomium strumarium TaxID=1170767 RepID=A0AAJ0M6V4_9PEZI|nr:Protoglobin-domain-containing protein [Chaetomium strumarium]
MSTARSRPMQHIDRKSLYTNLEARIQYLHSFLDFGSGDIDALRSGSKYIQALIPAVVNIVYRKLLQYDITARAFTTRSTSFEGPMDEEPDEMSPQILHRKQFLRAYLKKLCSDPSQMEFWEYLDKVGMMHTGIGRTHPLHIEYVHIGAALAVIQDILSEAILSHPRLHIARKIAIVKALGKVIWIQNDLFAKWYVHDGEEYTEGMDYEALVEREGFMHGKKVLAHDEESISGASDDSPAPQRGEKKDGGDAAAAPSAPVGVCPFTGMTTGMGGLKMQEGTVQDAKPKVKFDEEPKAAEVVVNGQ